MVALISAICGTSLARPVLGVVAEVSVLAQFSLSALSSCHAFDLGGSEGIEAVHEGDADMDFGGLAVRVS
ncbi:hypothetical protein [Paracoccus pantotrophus]|uniref:hypothetical protein n=1 Tax=Paracoccus pantotrophus TaxID=82367 RepID=UPI0011C026C3|nr:hypothetical protein [Paracoccus pantotrophus]